MTISDTRLKIAVFIDFDNIEIGVKSTLNTSFDIGTVLDALKERGEVVSKTAYSDWKRAGDYSRSLSQHAIKMVQRNLTPGGDKNGADINLALDALEMAFTHPHINAYVIVGGDSDFITLVEKLKQYDKKVMVVGGRSFTSAIMQRNCHEFIAYENLIGSGVNGRRAAERGGRSSKSVQSPIDQAVPLVKRALEVLADREVSPQLGLLKSTLLQLDSTFSERSFGASSFRDFAEKLESAGLVTLRHSGRNILVELKDGAVPGGRPAERAIASAPAHDEPPEAAFVEEAHPTEPTPVAARAPAPATSAQAPSIEATGGIPDLRRILARSKPQRFPMYVRNMKQLLRQTEPGFDERRFGFANLVDLLRALQREGMLRLERDRQGALRIHQGPAWPQDASAEPPVSAESEALLEGSVAAEARVVPEPAPEPAGLEEAVAAPAEEAPAPVEERPEKRRRPRRAKAAPAPGEAPKARKTGRRKPTPSSTRRRTPRRTPEPEPQA